jgi:hypothetical protein
MQRIAEDNEKLSYKNKLNRLNGCFLIRLTVKMTVSRKTEKPPLGGGFQNILPQT